MNIYLGKRRTGQGTRFFFKERKFIQDCHKLNDRIKSLLLGSKRIQQRIYFEYGRHRETKPFLCFIQHPADRVELVLIDKALEEKYNFRKDMQNRAKEIISELERTGKIGVVLCGRPYHCDKEIHHGIPNIINSFGIAVLTGDAVASLGSLDDELRVIDQWTYHSRLYRAATVVGKNPNLELIELNSFSCGIDAVTTDQVNEILTNHGKVHTLLKIDEISNLGAVKIRIRSLLAALEYKKNSVANVIKHKIEYKKAEFTKAMKKEYTILAPQMAPMHFDLIKHMGLSLPNSLR